MIHLTSRINTVEVIWVITALAGVFYGSLVLRDARRDETTRHRAAINSGRESIARLARMTAALMIYAFVIFLACGLGAMTIPNPPSTTPAGYVIQVGLVSAELSLAFVLYYTQRVRRRVLRRDIERERTRMLAAAAEAAACLAENTAALDRNSEAVAENTAARQEEGP